MLRILPRIFNARKLSLRTLNTEKPKVQKEKKEEMLAKKTPSGKLDELKPYVDPHLPKHPNGINPVTGEALQQTNPLLFKTLQVFSYGTVKDLPKEVDLPPAALSKLRQLSLISLAANGSSNRQLPYAEVMHFLELSATRELEDIVIDAIYNKLIKARLDSKGQFVEVDDWASRDTPLEAIPDIIDMFQQFSHRVADVRQSALQDADRRDAQVLADLKRAQQVEADLVAARKAHDESMLVSLNSHEPSTSTRSKASRISKIYYKKYLLCRSSEKERGRIEWLNTLDPPADVMISWGKRAPATKRDASAEASKWTVVILLASAGR
ncbi:hypothetical protein Q1695_009263 [Nippostrongylus brasiliensis]|nr:hypothetical protein Q1695_009263 [Nippostrongylus brasiliensis]